MNNLTRENSNTKQEPQMEDDETMNVLEPNILPSTYEELRARRKKAREHSKRKVIYTSKSSLSRPILSHTRTKSQKPT